MKLLIAIDGSLHSDNALRMIVKQPWPDASECRIVTVAAPFHRNLSGLLGGVGQMAATAERALEADLTQLLNETVAMLEKKFGKGRVSSAFLQGEPAERIVEEACLWHPDLIVMGSHGTSGYNDETFGSVTIKVVNHAPCSVRIVHYISSDSIEKEAKAHVPLDEERRFLIAINGSPNSQRAIDSVLSRPWLPGSLFQVLAVVEEPKSVFHSRFFKDPSIDEVHKKLHAAQRDAAEKLVKEAALKLETKFGKGTITDHVFKGNVRSLILQVAQDWPADMIILGAHDRDKSILEHFLGSVARAVVDNADCSVEIVRRPS